MTKKNSFYLLEPLQGIPMNKPEEKPEDWLARIVSDYSRPHAAFTPSEAREPYFEWHPDRDFSNLERVLKDVHSTKIASSLLDVLDISHEDFMSKKHTFRSRKVERLRIHHDETVLEQTLADPEVASDIEDWDLNVFSPMYFIVGLLVTNDITYNSSERSGHNTKAGVDPANALGAATGVPAGIVPSAKIEAEDKHWKTATAHTRASGKKRIFAVEYRSFRKHLRQRPGKVGKLGGYGPQGDRTFSDELDQADDDVEIQIELDPEPFSDIMEVDGMEERCLLLDDSE